MRAIEVQEFGGPEVLAPVERPEPAGAGKVRVRVRAATVNPADVAARAGALPEQLSPHKPPFVLGWDLSGTVLEDAGGFRAGQRVIGMVPWFEVGEGSYAEVVAADPGWLAALPDGADAVAAATLPLNALTARAAVDAAALPAGATVLVTGASGGVGGFAVQLAVAAGLQVVAVASAGDAEFVSGLGAKEVLVRTPDLDLAAAVRERYPDGVDAAVDTGSAGAAALGAVRDGGRQVVITGQAMGPGERGIAVEFAGVQVEQPALAAIAESFAAGRLQTRVAAVLPLEQAAEAHRRVEAGGFQGKVVLTP
jgi:NADPH:quinone reductase-like Zn-dependent oxidoreductase